MRYRSAPSLLLAYALIFTLIASVEASPSRQDLEPAIIQALNETAQELGLVAALESGVGPIGLEGSRVLPYWGVGPGAGGPIEPFTVVVFDYGSASQAHDRLLSLKASFSNPSDYDFSDFHNYPAAHRKTGYVWSLTVQNDRYLWQTVQSGPTLTEVDVAEIFYRHAVESGFMVGDSTAITLIASADGYSDVPQSIDNSANFGAVRISGIVTDSETGEPIFGARIGITSGATSHSTFSGPGGGYSLQAVVPGGQDSREVSGVNFPMQLLSDLNINIVPEPTELLADGSSKSYIVIQVNDLQGNPVKDRYFSLEVSSESGPGTISPQSAMTDMNGVIRAVYTSFKPEPGQGFVDGRQEVILTVTDQRTGIPGIQSIYLNQYTLDVQYNQYIPPCDPSLVWEYRCVYPSRFTVTVLDPRNEPVPNVPVLFRLEGMGTLVGAPDSNYMTNEYSASTDDNGTVEAYFKWSGRREGYSEYIQRVVVQEEVTNTSVTKEVKVQELDIVITRIEEVVGFTGITEVQAFIKIYFKDQIYSLLELERFNTNSPVEMYLRVEISRINRDGSLELVYDRLASWERDARGLYVKMVDTPHMPYVVPTVDGNNWFQIRVTPRVKVDSGYLPDSFLPDNDTVIALSTGSPAGWLHTLLHDGIIEPHSWTLVTLKCVARFHPWAGPTIAVIDYLSYIYAGDGYALGQNTAAMITQELQNRANPSLLSKLSAKVLNDVIQCAQDIFRVYHEKNQQGSSGLGGVCAALVYPGPETVRFEASDEDDAAMVRTVQDRFVQGMLFNSPDLRGVVVVGLEAGDVTVRDGTGQMVSDPERMSAEGQVAVYLLPVNEAFRLEVASDHAFDIGVYEAGGDETTRKTFRHEVQTESRLTASMAIGGSSNYDLKLDRDDDGAFETTLSVQATTLDVVKPQITSTQPEAGAVVSAGEATILATYADNPGGVGIDPQSINIYVDGIDRTAEATVLADGLALSLPDLEEGEIAVRMVVSDLDGNATVSDWTFIVQPGSSYSLNNSTLLIGIVGGCGFLILLLGAVFAISYGIRRSRRQSHTREPTEPVQDQQGNWWYQDPGTGMWSSWNGQSWEPAPGATPNIASPHRAQ